VVRREARFCASESASAEEAERRRALSQSRWEGSIPRDGSLRGDFFASMPTRMRRRHVSG
jgi:hypothetical protein